MTKRSIAAPNLATAMRWFVSNLREPALAPYLVSVDHSPSEQIDGSEWHHSVFVVSQNVEHQALADALGKALSPSTNTLRQWKRADQTYRTRFHQRFFHVLKEYPVLVVAASAKESSVLSNEQGLAHQLGIAGCYRRIEQGGKTKVEFGPYVHSGNEEPRTLVITDKQAPMAIFTANYLLRIHSALKEAICEKLGTSEVPLWMQVMSDKPPNDFGGPYAELMWLLLGGPATEGKFTWGGFTGNGDQPIDLLADNLAGLINEITDKKRPYNGPALRPPVTGVFYWESIQYKDR